MSQAQGVVKITQKNLINMKLVFGLDQVVSKKNNY